MTQTEPASGNESWLLILIDAVRHHWLSIGLCTCALGALGTYKALTSPEVYRAEAVLIAAPGLQETGGSLGGLGGLAGLVAGNNDSGQKLEALAILRSRAFSEKFIETHQLRPVLFAEHYDAQNKRWRDDDPPTVYSAYRLFDQEVRHIAENTTEGTVTVAIEWTDRNLAAQWSNQLVADLNRHVRERAIERYSATLEYLHAELQKNSEAGIREGIYGLIEENTRSIAMANVQQEYAFNVVDAAAPADEDAYIRPRRLVLIVAGAIIGCAFGLLLALLRRTIATTRPPRQTA